MDSQDVLFLQGVLSKADAEFCIVGEVTYNYYNIPRVIHDLEICVRDADVDNAQEALLALTEGSDITCHSSAWSDDEHNIFTEHKTALPRLRCASSRGHEFFLSLLPASSLHIQPFAASIVQVHQGNAVCSKEIQDFLFAPEDAHELRLPTLRVLIIGFATKFVESGYCASQYAMVAEGLVDGMDVDETWCARALKDVSDEIKTFVEGLVGSKRERLDYLYPEGASCFVRNEEETMEVRRVPGREA